MYVRFFVAETKNKDLTHLALSLVSPEYSPSNAKKRQKFDSMKSVISIAALSPSLDEQVSA